MSESHPSAATPYLAMAQRFASVVPHVAAMGIEVVAASVAKTTLKLPWQAKLVGNQDEGFLHGGVITTLIDSASGLAGARPARIRRVVRRCRGSRRVGGARRCRAVFLALEKPPSIATLDLRIDYLRPTNLHEAVIAEAECYRLTRNIAFVRARARSRRSRKAQSP